MIKKTSYSPIFLIAGLALASLAAFNFLGIKEAQTGASDNVSGWAWSDNIGWISFNNTTDGSGFNYGVNINNDGIFSGYAWSDNIGWISFNRPDTGAPPGSPDYGTYLAQVDLENGQVSGWARALSYGGGWDGWIKLRDANYGVYIDIVTGNFHDWAWGSDVVGWVNFDQVTTSFAFNRPPRVETGSAQVEYQNYCGVAPEVGQVGFKWTYVDDDGDPETRFEFQVDNNADFSSPEVNRNFTGLNNPSPTTNTQQVFVIDSPQSDKIVYGQSYWWQVKVYDNQGNDSGWVSGPSFSTVSHAYPYPNFSPPAQSPSVNESVLFTDNSKCYTAANAEYDCKDGADIQYAWDFNYIEAEGFTVDSTNKGDTTTSYPSAGSYKVRLRITDSSLTPAGVCTTQRQVSVTLPLPEWQEISPF